MAPNLPYQLGRTYQVGNKQVHTRTIFSLRFPTATQQSLQLALTRADAALTHSIAQARLRAPQLRNGAFILGPFDPMLGHPTLDNFGNKFLMHFFLDENHPNVVADYMDIFRNGCMTIQRNLLGPLELVDLPIMKQGTTLCGYVRSYREAGVQVKKGSIHIDLERITPATIDATADTLIHEASHKFILTKDNAYRHELGKWAALTASTAIDNADSISSFVLEAIQHNWM